MKTNIYVFGGTDLQCAACAFEFYLMWTDVSAVGLSLQIEISTMN